MSPTASRRCSRNCAPALPGVEIDSTIFRPATFIELSIAQSHPRACGSAACWSSSCSRCFLHDWRTAFISLTAIPLSLRRRRAGAALAGADAEHDGPRRPRHRARRGGGRRDHRRGKHPAPPAAEPRAGRAAARLPGRARRLARSPQRRRLCEPHRRARLPARCSSSTGSPGTFFRPLALSYILAIVASLVVALTVTPALCLMLLRGTALERKRDAPLVRAAQGRLPPRAAAAARACRGAVCIVLVVAFAGTWFAYTKLGEEFLPNFKERDFLMHWVEKPGDLARRDDAHHHRREQGTAHASPACATSARTSAAPRSPMKWSARTSRSCGSALDPNVDYDPTVKKVQEVVDGYPGLYRDLLTYLRERIKEVLTGASATIVVRIFGPDLPMLREQGRGSRRRVQGRARRDHAEGRAAGARAAGRRHAAQGSRRASTDSPRRRSCRSVATLVKGQKVGEVFEEQKIHDVAVWSVPEARTDINALRELLIDVPGMRARPARARSATSPTSPSCPRRTRSNARAPRAAST